MGRMKALATSKKGSIILSYISLAVHSASNIILTPLYLKYLGMDQYGLYQMIYTVASYILILDFGIKVAMVRYISKYHASNDYESERNFSAHCLITVTAIVIIMIGIGLWINIFLLKIYPTIAADEANTAHQLLLIMLLVITGTVFERFVSGCLAAYEHFFVISCVSVIKITLKVVLTISLLCLGAGVIAVALVDAIIIFGSIVLFSIYAIRELHFKVKLSKFEFALIVEIFSFVFPIFLQAIIGYINNYVDKTILGVMTSKSDVAIYSVAMTFITLFNSIPSVISGVFLPQATKLVFSERCNSDSLTNFVIRSGRYQFMLCGGFICGFVLFGKEFIILWAGPDAVQSWIIALIIMVSNMVPLIQNTVLSILDALKKRLFRSVVLFFISIINVLISIFLVSRYGMMGAPIGTALAFIFGYGVIMNIYYQKEIKIQVGRMFRTIFSRTWLCLIPPVILGILCNMHLSDYSWISFLSKCFVFLAIYGSMLLAYGLNSYEKNDILSLFKRFGIKISCL